MRRPWHFSFEVDKTSSNSIHNQLIQHFRHMIEHGHWQGGTPLPSTREIADRLNINRKTVTRAYEELSALGYLYTAPKKGTFVAQKLGLNSTNITTIHHNPPSNTKPTEPCFDDIYQLIQKTTLQHIRRVALYMHKLKASDFDLAGLHSLKHMLANILIHDHGLLVRAHHLICSSRNSIEMGVVKLLQLRHGHLLVDQTLPATTKMALELAGVPLLVIPHIPPNQPIIMIEQIEKFCINYPVSAIWCNTHILFEPACCAHAHRLLSNTLADYQLLLIDDQRGVTHTGPQAPLSAHYTHLSVYLGSLYADWCETFNLYYVAAQPAQIQTLMGSLDASHQHSLLLNMLAQTELIKRGDYKKMLAAILKQDMAKPLIRSLKTG